MNELEKLATTYDQKRAKIAIDSRNMVKVIKSKDAHNDSELRSYGTAGFIRVRAGETGKDVLSERLPNDQRFTVEVSKLKSNNTANTDRNEGVDRYLSEPKYHSKEQNTKNPLLHLKVAGARRHMVKMGQELKVHTVPRALVEMPYRHPMSTKGRDRETC